MIKKYIPAFIAAAILIVFFIALLILNTTLSYKKPGDAKIGIAYEKATVLQITKDTIQPDPDYEGISIGYQELIVEITSGEHAGKRVTIPNLVERIVNIPAKVGTKLIVASYDGFITASVVDYDREMTVYALIGAFVLVVVLFGRWKGVKSLLGLLFTLLCIVFLFIPLVIKGFDPIPVALLVALLSTTATFLLIGGLCEKTLTAAISCALCTLLAGLIAYAAGLTSHITTMNTPEAEDLLFVMQGNSMQIHNLLFAGILFSSLGAIMDTSMSIASSITEIKTINNTLTAKQLYKSGMNIGRDIMGTMTNTLILAFAGSGINLFILFAMYGYPYVQLINLQLLVIELIQGLSGSIALVLSIPVTSLIASGLYRAVPKNRFRVF